jgi:starch synthase (maltosyl-transferring)
LRPRGKLPTPSTHTGEEPIRMAHAEDDTAPMGPRIYNLFPTLLGPLPRWHERLPAIAEMGFDWIFLNPIHQPGASGSLYSIKDMRELHPLLRPAGADPSDDDAALRAFFAAAQDAGIRVMLDLVINHTARDGVLVDEHPEWFAHDGHGNIRSPSVADLDNPDQVTVWEDLAELDYTERPAREALLTHWEDTIRCYLALGIHGFRCDAAYKLPGEVWKRLIDAARARVPDVRFFAETLGAPQHAIEQLRGAGFDYQFNSSKWWDFRAGWLLDQYDKLRDLAPSIAFPESHDTVRRAAEGDGSARESRFWYLFAAVFSSGVMMPIGYELGFAKALHVVETTPEDWDAGCAESCFDISAYIGRVNAMKAATPVLNEEGPQARVTDPNETLVGLARRSEHGGARSLALINPDPEQTVPYGTEALAGLLGTDAAKIHEITPAKPGGGEIDKTAWREAIDVPVPPRSIRVFVTG